VGGGEPVEGLGGEGGVSGWYGMFGGSMRLLVFHDVPRGAVRCGAILVGRQHPWCVAW
jgi:hypothetical protein